MIDTNQSASRNVSCGRFIRKIALNLCKSHWLSASIRCRLARLGGVNIDKSCFLGEGVLFDTIRPELITIGKGCTITARCCILSHFRKGSTYYYGDIKIGNRVFIGIGTVIANSVSIGDNVIIGAGSIVTKDIPTGEVWAGNPAKFIKKREDYTK